MNYTLKQRLIDMRILNAKSQKWIADELGVNRHTVARWESGVSIPCSENISQLCKLFDVPIDFFLGDSTTARKLLDEAKDKVLASSQERENIETIDEVAASSNVIYDENSENNIGGIVEEQLKNWSSRCSRRLLVAASIFFGIAATACFFITACIGIMIFPLPENPTLEVATDFVSIEHFVIFLSLSLVSAICLILLTVKLVKGHTNATKGA